MNDFTGASVLEAARGDGFTASTITAASTQGVVRNIAGWLLGVAIAIIVLKVALTGIDRMFLDNMNDSHDQSPLESIPVLGAYPRSYEWKDIWLNFATNLAIVLGVWVAVTVIAGAISWFSGVVL